MCKAWTWPRICKNTQMTFALKIYNYNLVHSFLLGGGRGVYTALDTVFDVIWLCNYTLPVLIMFMLVDKHWGKISFINFKFYY